MLGPSLTNTMIAIGIVYTPQYARLARGSTLSVKERDFVDAAVVSGANDARIIWRHILPNVAAPLIIQTSLSLSLAILAEASLSFLGLGTQPPDPSWGTMVNTGQRLIELSPWPVVFPGLAIILAVLGIQPVRRRPAGRLRPAPSGLRSFGVLTPVSVTAYRPPSFTILGLRSMMAGLSPRRRLVEASLVLGVFLAALLVFGTAKAKIDSDEGNWIGTTRYFETYFIQRDFSPEAWADGYWTRTQPMVFRYVIGSWLWLRGHDLQIQNPNYDYSKTAAANRRLGIAPSDDVLLDARMPARLMAALAVTMLYLVVRVLAGPLGGLAAAISATGQPVPRGAPDPRQGRVDADVLPAGGAAAGDPQRRAALPARARPSAGAWRQASCSGSRSAPS